MTDNVSVKLSLIIALLRELTRRLPDSEELTERIAALEDRMDTCRFVMEDDDEEEL